MKKQLFFLISLFLSIAALSAQDDCSSAITLNCSDFVTGFITGVSTPAPATSCGGIGTGDVGGVWYSFIGDGQNVELALNAIIGSVNDLREAKLAVYKGSCNTLECLGGDQGVSLEYAFISELGETYYFYVTGDNANTGSFQMGLNCLPGELLISNDICLNATELSCSTTSIMGTTTGSSNDNNPSCGESSNYLSGGVWYTLVGDNQEVTVTVDGNLGSAGDLSLSQIAVYRGDCGGLACVGGAADNFPSGSGNSQYTFIADSGMSYYLYISGSYASSGDFELSLSCSNVVVTPDNNVCANAVSLNAGETVSGTTIGATTSNNLPSCTTAESGESNLSMTNTSTQKNGDKTGVWYVFDSFTPDEYIVIEYDVVTFNTNFVFEVYTGECGNFSCVPTTTSNLAKSGNTFSWTSTATATTAATYYIYVANADNDSGNFELSLTSDATPVLPVELSDFRGETLEKANRLEWITSAEDNTMEFVVERVADLSRQWDAIGTVTAAGHSRTNVYYSFEDEEPLGTAYYRLRITDFDGTVEFSDLIQLKREEIEYSIQAYPVPTKGQLTLSISTIDNESTSIQVTDVTGRLVKSEPINLFSGSQNVVVDVSDLMSGIYFVRVELRGQYYLERIIKE